MATPQELAQSIQEKANLIGIRFDVGDLSQPFPNLDPSGAQRIAQQEAQLGRALTQEELRGLAGRSPLLERFEEFGIPLAADEIRFLLGGAGVSAPEPTQVPIPTREPERIRLPSPAPGVETGTTIGDISLGPGVVEEPAFETVEELITGRQPTIADILTQTIDEAIRLEQLGRTQATEQLSPFLDLQALQEQEALLGLRGEQAQETAVGDIPVSEFDRTLQRRQRETLLRQAAARGELGAGATIEQAGRLGGQQQAALIQGRLGQLTPLADISRTVTRQLAGIDEASLARQAALESQRGADLANLELSLQTPLIQSRLAEVQNLVGQRIAEAEQTGVLSTSLAQQKSLADIARAQSRGQLLQGIGSLAGQAVGSFSTQRQKPISTANLQSGTERAFFPQAGQIGIA